MRLLAACVAGVVLAGCGSEPAPEGDQTPSVQDEPTADPGEDPTVDAEDDPAEDRDDDADEGGPVDEPVDEPDDDTDVADEPSDDDVADVSIAPLCADVDDLAPTLADGVEPTGTSAEPQLDASVPDDDVDPGSIPMVAAIQDWVAEHAADDFAGLWIDQDLPGYVVAFSDDVERHAEAIRAEVDPRLGVAEAELSSDELDELEERLAEEWAASPDDGSDIVWLRSPQTLNRVIVVFAQRNDDRLAELSEEYGTSAICFVIYSEA